MTKTNLGSEIYSGAASFGRFRAFVGVIIGTLLGLALIVGGIVAISHKIKRTSTVTGYPVDNRTLEILPGGIPKCGVITDKNNTTYDCNFTLKYEINDDKSDTGKFYLFHTTSFHETSDINYSGMHSVPLYYNPKNPGDASLTKDDFHTVGWVMIAFGLFVLIASWISLWVVLHYKFAAAASGVGGAYDMIANI